MAELFSLPEGTMLNGTYRIERFIGSGGFGCTYAARHVLLDKRVAIKEFFISDFCNRDSATGHVSVGTASRRAQVEKLKGKFVLEARALSQMDHRGIVRVSNVFEENGTAYYVMDYIEGSSLREIVAREGRLSEERAVRYMLQVCEALEYVHSLNRLHLDIKPGNIMIDGRDNAVLIDFGASKQYDEESGEGTSTLLGYSVGYAPPEQMGSDVKRFDPAIDIYALGATLYNMLTGETPPAANKRLGGSSELKPLVGVSDGVRSGVEKAMMLDRRLRPQTVAAFAAMLTDRTVIDPPKATPPVGNPKPSTGQGGGGGGPTRRIKEEELPKNSGGATRKTVAIMAAAFVACVIAAFLLFGNRQETEQEGGIEEEVVDADTTVAGQAPSEKVEAKQEGMLSVDFKPVGTEVWIDGSKAGTTGKTAREFGPLTAGNHKVELRKSGYATVTYKSLTITADATRELRGELEEEELSASEQASSTSTSSSGTIAGHAYVDLGLSVKWATCNVGASSPEDYGDYYAWGETKTKSSYDEDNCETWEKQIGDIGGTSRDVAHVKWGGTWRMPTKAEFRELLNNCTWTWTTRGGHAGYKVTGKNGNSIFLPAAGWRGGTSLYDTGSYGYYWSSTPYESDAQIAYGLGFYSGDRGTYWYDRGDGRSVRPVAG